MTNFIFLVQLLKLQPQSTLHLVVLKKSQTMKSIIFIITSSFSKFQARANAKLIIVLLLLICATSTFSQTLSIEISGIRNAKGKICLAFFRNEKDFKSETPAFTKTIYKSEAKNGIINVKYTDIKTGQYGIALLDDENGDGKMNYSFFIPTEGFGFSDYYHNGLKKPAFSNFCFNFKDVDKTVKIKVRYM